MGGEIYTDAELEIKWSGEACPACPVADSGWGKRVVRARARARVRQGGDEGEITCSRAHGGRSPLPPPPPPLLPWRAMGRSGADHRGSDEIERRSSGDGVEIERRSSGWFGRSVLLATGPA